MAQEQKSFTIQFLSNYVKETSFWHQIISVAVNLFVGNLLSKFGGCLIIAMVTTGDSVT